MPVARAYNVVRAACMLPRGCMASPAADLPEHAAFAGNGGANGTANGVNGTNGVHVHKIKVANPVVDLDGDEMTRCAFEGGA